MGICSYNNKDDNISDSTVITIQPDSTIITIQPDSTMRNNILIPKYNELDQSPPSCFNTRCINKHITQGQSPPINTHCINKHITQEQNLDEYYYNKYMR